MFNFLSNVSLSSWDEAWYAVISRNIFEGRGIFNLAFNGKPFFDHPPFVFWLQAISYNFFGVNEFAVRLPSFILAIGTSIALYLLGKELFSKSVGFFSAVSVFTAPWFLTRSLSGNLDIPLTFLFVLSFLLAIKSSQNKNFLIPLSISLSFLFLTKSLVPFTIVPALFFILWKKINLKSLVTPTLLFLCITLPWFVINQINNPGLINRYLSIGYPGVKTDTNIWQNILLTKTYLHNGIGSWFVYGLMSLGLGFLLSRKKYIPIIAFVSTFLLPFAFSDKGHIWHLIPLYPFWILAFFGMLDLVPKKYKLVCLSLSFMFISWNQVKRNWYEIVKAPSYTSDLEILSSKSRDYDLPLYLDDDAVPEVLFYSEKNSIERTYGRGDLRTKFDEQRKFMLITRDWRIDEEKINSKEYTLIGKDRDKVLIIKN